MKPSIRFITSSCALLVACWSSKPVDAPAKSLTEDPAEIALRTLRSDAPFDLAFPSKPPPRRHAASAAAVTACRAGHHPSCWLLLHIATTDAAFDVGFKDVIAQCRRGDLSSCQAIPPLPHPDVPPGLPGWHGRLLMRRKSTVEAEALAPLRDECRDGFAYSCKVLADRSPDPDERAEMQTKTSVVAREACARNVPEACSLVDDRWPMTARLAALDWNCQVRRSACRDYAAALLELGRYKEAHAEYERACQYGRQSWICLELVALYRDGTFAEPAPDRAATLLRVSCADEVEHYPECAP